MNDNKPVTRAHSSCAGGLRLDPASPDLWSCLGACAESAGVREYAVSRALALDPKRARDWAALGRPVPTPNPQLGNGAVGGTLSCATPRRATCPEVSSVTEHRVLRRAVSASLKHSVRSGTRRAECLLQVVHRAWRAAAPGHASEGGPQQLGPVLALSLLQMSVLARSHRAGCTRRPGSGAWRSGAWRPRAATTRPARPSGRPWPPWPRSAPWVGSLAPSAGPSAPLQSPRKGYSPSHCHPGARGGLRRVRRRARGGPLLPQQLGRCCQ